MDRCTHPCQMEAELRLFINIWWSRQAERVLKQSHRNSETCTLSTYITTRQDLRVRAHSVRTQHRRILFLSTRLHVGDSWSKQLYLLVLLMVVRDE